MIKPFLTYHSYPIAWGAVILLLCGLQGNQFPEFKWDLALSFDKLVHFFFYAVLSLLVIVAQIKQHRYSPRRFRAVRIALTSSISFGVLVEGLQAFVFFQRSADWNDVIANTIGSFIGVGLFYMIYGNSLLRKDG